MKKADIARRRDGTVDKTPYNVLTGANPPKLQSLESLAQRLEVPLWVLMIPGIPDELCNDAGLKSIERLVTNFWKSESRDRHRLSEMADGFAAAAKKTPVS